MRTFDFAFPGIDVGAGRTIGGGSVGRTPEALADLGAEINVGHRGRPGQVRYSPSYSF